jgi:DNA invertase Pin-like site-specific DNA recombinase
MVPTIQHLERLNSYGVTFEPHLCADNEMVRGILLAVLATMAKQEAKRLSERVVAGMRKAAAKGTKRGKPIGRPRVDAETERAIRRGGTDINKTAATVGVGAATVQRVRAEMGATPLDDGGMLENISRARSTGCSRGNEPSPTRTPM